MKALALSPVDTWFFRDGTPFDMEGSPQVDVGGVFPPHPSTVAGALRAALALSNGWSGKGPWSRELEKVLGTGPEELGQLTLTAPLLLEGGQPLFPMPRHVVGSREADGTWTLQALLAPSQRGACCDLGGAAHLPESPDPKLKPAEGLWLTQRGLESVLAGKVPAASELRYPHKLWKEEPRIGIQRERATRTVQEEGGLYSTRHVRPCKGVALGALLRGLPAGWKLPVGHLVPLGGESRLAECQAWEAPPPPASPRQELERTRRFTVVALTPLLVDEAVRRGKQSWEELGGARVVSACLDRPLRIGGWDSLRREPLPMRDALPPGSTFFCEAEEGKALGPWLERGGAPLHVGAWKAAGFGWVALGTWSTVKKETP